MHKAFAPLVWNAQLNASLATGKKSKAIDLSWSTSYGTSCTPDTLMVRYNKVARGTATAPDPTDGKDGALLGYLDTDETSTTHMLVHAYTSYAYTIYACETSGCSVLCTGNQNDDDEVITEKERWVVHGVHDYTDTGVGVLDLPLWRGAADPELHAFQAGTHDDKVGMFFHGSTSGTPGDPHGIYMITTGTTWTDDVNDPDQWSDPEQLIQVTSSSGDYPNVSNIMVVPTRDGATNNLLRLFWTTDHRSSPEDPEDNTIHSLLSTDHDGDDYGVCCSDSGDCSSTTGCLLSPYSEVCCDFEDATVVDEFEVESHSCLSDAGWHGHDLWNDLGPTWNPATDELTFLISGTTSGTPLGECQYCDDEAGADLVRWDLDGGCSLWDSDTGAKFCLEGMWEDGDTADTAELEDTADTADLSWCPDESWWVPRGSSNNNVHDPAAFPYPTESKIYVKAKHTRWLVGYSSDNGRTIEDTSAIEFYFEDEDSGDTAVDTDDVLDPGCVEDLALIPWSRPSFKRELMLFVPKDQGSDNRARCFATQDTGVDDDDEDYWFLGGLLAAVLHN